MDWLRSKGSNASAPSPEELLFLWQLGKLKKSCPLPTPTLFIMPRRQEGVPSTQYLLQKLKVCTLEKETEPTANVSLHSKGGTGRVEKNRGRSIKRRGQEGGKRAKGGQQESRPHPLLGHQQLLLGILLLDVVVLNLHFMCQLQPLLQGLRSIP